MTQRSLAASLGVAPSQVARYKKMGMPFPITVEDARTWKDQNLTPTISKTGPKPKDDAIEDDIFDSITFDLPEGKNAEDVLNRIREQERTLAGRIGALEKLPSTSKLAVKLSRLRKDHREQAKLSMSGERLLLDMRIRKGELIELEEAKEYVRAQMLPISQLIRSIPSLGTNEGEREVLAKVANRMLRELVGISAVARNALTEGTPA